MSFFFSKLLIWLKTTFSIVFHMNVTLEMSIYDMCNWKTVEQTGTWKQHKKTNKDRCLQANNTTKFQLQSKIIWNIKTGQKIWLFCSKSKAGICVWHCSIIKAELAEKNPHLLKTLLKSMLTHSNQFKKKSGVYFVPFKQLLQREWMISCTCFSGPVRFCSICLVAAVWRSGAEDGRSYPFITCTVPSEGVILLAWFITQDSFASVCKSPLKSKKEALVLVVHEKKNLKPTS